MGRKNISDSQKDTRNFSKETERDNERNRAKKRREYDKRDKGRKYSDDDYYDE